MVSRGLSLAPSEADVIRRGRVEKGLAQRGPRIPRCSNSSLTIRLPDGIVSNARPGTPANNARGSLATCRMTSLRGRMTEV